MDKFKKHIDPQKNKSTYMTPDKNITVEELIFIMESMRFKSTFKDRGEHPVFSFKDGLIVRDSFKLGQYTITKKGDNFKIRISETDEVLFTDIYRDIVLIVKEDNRFPISMNFSHGSLDIIFEGIQHQQDL